ncbi:MAG: hypothetical protein UMV23_05695 [Halanaerobium sp.]|nr:hypothetical protein [Halanaerobium sp.]
MLSRENKNLTGNRDKLLPEVIKIKKSAYLLLVILALFILLAVSNPTQDQFTQWMMHQANSKADSGLEVFFNKLFTEAMLEHSTARHDYLFFSVFVVEGRDEKASFIGILKQFIRWK